MIMRSNDMMIDEGIMNDDGNGLSEDDVGEEDDGDDAGHDEGAVAADDGEGEGEGDGAAQAAEPHHEHAAGGDACLDLPHARVFATK